jgi:ketosteroid isomerase-like protein
VQGSPSQPNTGAMPSASNVDVVRQMWDLYAAGRAREVLDHVDADVEWRPLLDGAVYRGHDELAGWARRIRGDWKSLTVVVDRLRAADGDCVVVSGRVLAFDHDGEQPVDSTLVWVAVLRDERVVRALAFADHGQAEAWLSARRGRP